MKRCWAFLLALCMAFSPAAMATTGPISTEKLLGDLIGALAINPAAWLEIDAPQGKLAAGVTMDENGLPGAGAYYQDEENTYAAAADATGVLLADGSETMDLPWDQLFMEMLGLQEGAMPQLTDADKALLAEIIVQIFAPVGDLVTAVESSATLDGEPAQRMEITIPLQQMCRKLDESLSTALAENQIQLDAMLQKNRAFLLQLGLDLPSVSSLREQWQLLQVGALLPDGVNAVIRMTVAGDSWQLEAEMLAAGAVIHFDGEHADGRLYWYGGEWSFDTRDFVQALGWLQEILLHLSRKAVDVVFEETAGTVHLRVQFDLQQFVADFCNGMNAVFTRHAAEIETFLQRYLPGTDPETLRCEVDILLKRMLMRSCSMRQMTLDALYKPTEMLDVSIDMPVFTAKLTVNAGGMNGSAQWISGSVREGVDVQGSWNDELHLLVRTMYGGRPQMTLKLKGVVEDKKAAVFTLSQNDSWLATARLHASGLSLETAAGLEGSLTVGENSLALHGSLNGQTLDAAGYVLDGAVSASVSCSTLEGGFTIREERGGWHMRTNWEYWFLPRFSTVNTLEAGVFEDGFMLRAVNSMRSRGWETVNSEFSLEARPDHVSGTWNQPSSELSFTWMPGYLSARSQCQDSYLTVVTHLLAADMTQPADEGNVLQVKFDQELIYPAETIENQKVYTVHSTVPESRTLLVNVTGEDCEINAKLELLNDTERVHERIEALLDAAQQPEPTPAPKRDPSESVFLTQP